MSLQNIFGLILCLCSFLVESTFAQSVITRGPYLQLGTSSNIVVRWRTDVASDSQVHYGTTATVLDQTVTDDSVTTEHELLLTGLTPYTQYFYDVGDTSTVLAGDDSFFFITSPTPGTVQPVRIWAIGDFGTGFPAQSNVRDTYAAFTGSRYTDLWLMLGDNAYDSGQDEEFQAHLFDVYPTLLRQSVAWPTVGNHETGQDQSLRDDYPYFQIFSMPVNGEAGGTPSGTKHYYSFDYANIHFICLDSMTAVYRQPDSPMINWLKVDLAGTPQDWIIVYFHHPAYSKGSHNSDTEIELIQMRENIVPILEANGVDLVLWGHSHNYERSFLLDGFYGSSSTVNLTNFIDHGDGRTNGTGAYTRPAAGLGARHGTVYVTDGSAGGQTTGGLLNHPAMYYSTYSPGSLVLDVQGQRLDGTFIREDGAIDDYFTIDKNNVTNVSPQITIAKSGTNAVLSWPTSNPDYRLESAATVKPPVSWDVVSTGIATNGRRKMLSIPSNTGTNRFFQLRRSP